MAAGQAAVGGSRHAQGTGELSGLGTKTLAAGFPKKAVEALENAPDSDEARLWRARGLKRSGHYTEAMKIGAALAEVAPWEIIGCW